MKTELSWTMTSWFSPEGLYIYINLINNHFTTKMNHHWTYLSWTVFQKQTLLHYFPVISKAALKQSVL